MILILLHLAMVIDSKNSSPKGSGLATCSSYKVGLGAIEAMVAPGSYAKPWSFHVSDGNEVHDMCGFGGANATSGDKIVILAGNCTIRSGNGILLRSQNC